MLRLTQRIAALAAPALALTGCYIVPVTPDGTPIYPYPYPQAGTSYGAVPALPVVTAPPPAPAPVTGPPMPAQLSARLYPMNSIATQTGMITGTVTNMMTGKGRFQMDYKGELLTGEATRVSGDEKRGVANAYGPRGTYMSCEYRLDTPFQGAGTCTMSNGAKYEVHLGG